jgi:hypothetical protein
MQLDLSYPCYCYEALSELASHCLLDRFYLMTIDKHCNALTHLGNDAGMRNLRTSNFQRSAIGAADEIKEYLGRVPSQRLLSQAKRCSDDLPTSYSDITISRSLFTNVPGLNPTDELVIYIKGSGAFEIRVSDIPNFLKENEVESFRFVIGKYRVSVAYCSQRRGFISSRAKRGLVWRCQLNETPWSDRSIVEALGL